MKTELRNCLIKKFCVEYTKKISIGDYEGELTDYIFVNDKVTAEAVAKTLNGKVKETNELLDLTNFSLKQGGNI